MIFPPIGYLLSTFLFETPTGSFFSPFSQIRKRKGGDGGGASDSTSPVRGNDAKRKRAAASPSNGKEGTANGDEDPETEQSGADLTEKEGASEEVRALSERSIPASFRPLSGTEEF